MTPIQFDVTISVDKQAGTVDVFPLREDADAKLDAFGFLKYRDLIYPFRNLPRLLECFSEMDLLVDPTYL